MIYHLIYQLLNLATFVPVWPDFESFFETNTFSYQSCLNTKGFLGSVKIYPLCNKNCCVYYLCNFWERKPGYFLLLNIKSDLAYQNLFMVHNGVAISKAYRIIIIVFNGLYFKAIFEQISCTHVRQIRHVALITINTFLL